jgi:hypothetical protein
MADNIKIIGNINDIRRVSRIDVEDQSVLSPQILTQNFNYKEDYIEFFVYSLSNELIFSNSDYRNYKSSPNYGLGDGTISTIEIDPINDVKLIDFISGEFISQYNFFKPTPLDRNNNLFIQQISDDRTELRINSTTISSTDLISKGQLLIDDLVNSSTQKYFLFNQNNNYQNLIVNIAIDLNSQTPTILLKLYKPLPSNINVKSQLWITEEITEPYVFGINIDASVIPNPGPKLKGPNFDIDIDFKQNVSTRYESYSSLISSLTGSSYSKALNYSNNKSYDLNIDYTSFENFIHFGSAKKRLEIFYYKINQIESYNTDISTLLSSTSILKNQETASIKLKIDNIISNFDGFENYLYFESSSYSWPKTTNTKPYKNKFINKQFHQIYTSSVWNFTHSLNETPTVVSVYSSSLELLPTQSSTIGLNTISITFASPVNGHVILTSPSASTWYNLYTSSAELYDDNNLDYLYYTIPNFAKNDVDNYQPYYDFVDMIGHYFDNVWIYITSINELYNADNNLEKGVSKDIVYDALKSLGVKLYNSKGNNQFNDYIGGSNTGSIDFINDFSATSSYLNNIPKKDLLSELYKRIYHNIPLLSKTKGTKSGLQNLITTFGVTSSIFEPKEFGGSNSYSQLKGYDNDKVTIQNNTITGSVLSPFISVQQPTTSSKDFTSTDLHFVDLSFSPQTQLDARISASIALLNPTFSLDQYIGDPRLMESSSYSDLIIQQNHFISASAAISGSAQRLDYKGFIELVKYFDNSLFKMLNDFVPARANTLTGVTIKSPVLERNKIAIYQPDVTEQEIYQADYNAPTIKEDNDYYYDKLSGSKSSFYTGEITGSYINTYKYFTDSNPNSYLHPSRSFSLNQFNHSDFNVMLNNITGSRTSVSRYKVESIYNAVNNKIFTTQSTITQYSSSAELQDSNLELRGFDNSRYEGTKIYSLKYNVYNSSSEAYVGDSSFGKNAVIDQYTRKIGLFTQIKDNTLLTNTNKNTTVLKYLVDENGSLTELNKKNKNWVEVQNLFKEGEFLTIAQFNPEKNPDQKNTDGDKQIYNSGYNYLPILYATGSGTTENLYFQYSGADVSKLFKSTNLNGGFISGSSNNLYPLKPSGSTVKVIYNIFDQVDFNDNLLFKVGNSTNLTFPSYSVPAKGTYAFNTSIDIGIQFQATNQSCSFKYDIIKGGIIDGFPSGNIIETSEVQKFVTSYRIDVLARGYNLNFGDAVFQDIVDQAPIPSTNFPLFVGSSLRLTYVSENLYSDGTPPGGNNNDKWKSYIVKWRDSNGANYVNLVFSKLSEPIDTFANDDYITNSSNINGISQNLNGNVNLRVKSGGIILEKNDNVYFKLSLIDTTTNNFTASFLSPGELINNLTSNIAGDTVFATGTNSDSFIRQAISSSAGNIDTLVFNEGLSSFNNYLFIPTTGSTDLKKLYNTYGGVNDVFNPIENDIVALYWSNQSAEFKITRVFNSGSNKCLTLDRNLPDSLKSEINNPSPPNQSTAGVGKFVILRRVPDETNIILSFDRAPGLTSAGFVIPNNLHPSVLDNIDIITKEVKQKLIDIGSPDAGTYS